MRCTCIPAPSMAFTTTRRRVTTRRRPSWPGSGRSPSSRSTWLEVRGPGPRAGDGRGRRRLARLEASSQGLSMSATAEPDPASLIEAYFERGWTDGLPVVPPTEKSVAEILAGAGVRRGAIHGDNPRPDPVLV